MQKLMKAMHKNEKGFTLVELMVVVVIIGILIAIAIPIYNNITRNAERSAVEANLRIIDGSIVMYFAEQGIYPSVPVDHLEGQGYLTEWPVGPGGASYGIEINVGSPNRATVSGEVGGTTLTNDTLPITWP